MATILFNFFNCAEPPAIKKSSEVTSLIWGFVRTPTRFFLFCMGVRSKLTLTPKDLLPNPLRFATEPPDICFTPVAIPKGDPFRKVGGFGRKLRGFGLKLRGFGSSWTEPP